MRLFKAGGLYFLLTFAVGFAFGTVRQLFVAPRIGEMWAELLEMPFMLAVVVAAASHSARRLAVPPAISARAGMGLTGLSLLVAAEASLVVFLRGMTLSNYIDSREPISGAAYLVMLVAYAAMPALLAAVRRRSYNDGGNDRTAAAGARASD